MNDFSQRIANLSPEKRALLEAHLKRKTNIAERAIPRLARDGQTQSFPVSFAEQRLWFLDQWQPNNPLYNIGIVYTFEGALNVGMFEHCLKEIVSRHESLRTSFSSQDGEPVQVIHPNVDLSLAFTDLCALPEDQREGEARKLAVQEAQAGFDLTMAPLLRVRLLRLAAEKHVLLTTVHHIVSDGWSIGIFFKELSELYSAYSHGMPPSLAELAIQYADYAVWQRQWLQDKELDKQRTYWKRQLAASPVLLELPTDRLRPARQSFNGARQTWILPKRLGNALTTLSQREGATLFMTLLAAFQILLSRYTRQKDIVVGSPIAGRLHAETENLIGFFVNTLVLRTDLSGDPSFRKLLYRVRETALGAYANQDLPFEKLVEELNPERALSHSPLFQVMFALQNMGPLELHLPGTTVSKLEIERLSTKFDLSVTAFETGEELRLYADHSTDLFDAETIMRLLGHYEILLENIIADPNRKIADLALMSEQERKLVLVDWNNVRQQSPSDECVHQLFEAQVEKTPNAIALVFEDDELTYAELNAKANRLAHYLVSLGVGPEVLAGVCLERSIEMIVALFAILKAGGAYLPLDPVYPGARIAFMLEDGRVPVLITQKHLQASLPQHTAKLITLDTEAIGRYPATNPKSKASSDNFAYVIYTSGSTGRPKGIAIEHRSTVALLSWAKEVFAPRELTGVLASTSICFDLSVFEIFVPLSFGGTVVLAENVLQLPALTTANKVTLINTVPSAITELLRIGDLPASVRTVNLAGESLSTQLVQQLYEKGIERVYDLYGPSEDTTYSTFALRSSDGRATIGRPIANTQVYLLDPNLSPVPIGVAGELHIGGAGLARGYLNRPELTAEKFIPNPFSDDTNARLYKTGDLARYLADGNIEFLGRMDDQVKIRGFRIELGEIESVLKEHPTVKACAVVAREDQPNDKRLIAYIVPAETPPVASGVLREFLRQKLPDYMLPSAFIGLDKLPLTPNGKLDRKALPTPDKTRSAECFVGPRTPNEQALAAIWAEVLKLDPIGIHDNFFDMGGHSLLATQVISRVKRTFELDIPLRALFESPTVAGLSALIVQKQAEGLGEDELAQLLTEAQEQGSRE